MFGILIKFFCTFLFIISGILFFFIWKRIIFPITQKETISMKKVLLYHEQAVIPYLVISIFLFILSIVLFIFQSKSDKK